MLPAIARVTHLFILSIAMRPIRLLLCFILCTSYIHAQQSETDRELLEQLRQEYKDFRRQREQEYAKYLQQTWIDFQLYKGLNRFNQPKPDTIPDALPNQSIYSDEITSYKISDTPGNTFIPPIEINSQQQEKQTYQAIIPFYGTTFPLTHTPPPSVLNGTEKDKIGHLWKSFGCKETDQLIADIFSFKIKHKLNDWGLFLLIKEVCNHLPQLSDENVCTLFRHFILFSYGYNVRLGIIDRTIVLLVPFRETVYNQPFLYEDKKKYFLFTDKALQSSTIVRTLPLFKDKTEKVLSLEIKENMDLGNDSFDISHTYQDTSFNITINRERTRFFQNIPSTDLTIYTNAMADPIFEDSLLSFLYQFNDLENVPETLNDLLHFCQSTFTYKTDEEQFGYEKTFFPEETFFYPFSDCEDRAVLFAYIVRKTLKLDTILLKYSNHVVTGVALKGNIPGTYIQFDKKRYLLCDPSYRKADIGQCMPDYKNEIPQIVPLQ